MNNKEVLWRKEDPERRRWHGTPVPQGQRWWVPTKDEWEDVLFAEAKAVSVVKNA